MRSIINGEVSQYVLKLQQIGAQVNVINSRLCYVSFDLGGFLVQYVYNVNHKDNYFLERVKPYPRVLDEFDNEKDLVKLIKSDVEKFRNALKCHHIELFVTMAREINRTFVNFEDTYLNYNLPEKEAEDIYKEIISINDKLDKLKETCKPVFNNEVKAENKSAE